MINKSKDVDDTLFLGVITGATLALLIWTSIVVYDIQKDVKDIRVTLDTIQETLKSIEHSNMILETDISSKSK